MPWFRVDDSFYDHPKVFDAPDCAVALWLRAGTWSARNLTDGYVPSTLLARLCGDPETAARELVQRGLWSRVKGGYQFHAWADYQPTRESVENERKAARDRMRKKRKPTSDGELFARTSQEHRPNFGRSSQAPTRPDPRSVVDVINRPNGSKPDPAEIDQMIMTEISQATGRVVDITWAAMIRQHILDGREPADPAAYIRQAIRSEPHPRTRFLPADRPPPAAEVLAAAARREDEP